MNEAIAKAVDEIARDSRTGDILVFLPGEREIREAAETLRKHHPKGTEILPLFSRLSAEEQDRVFERGRAPPHRARDQRRRDLAHGARHPLRDRHGPRARQALQPAAEDRPAAHRADLAGRGAAAGRALRPRRERHRHPPLRRGGLHAARPEFTTPEILRTSLASRHPAHGGARAGRRSRRSRSSSRPRRARSRTATAASSSWAPSTRSARSRRWATSWRACRSTRASAACCSPRASSTALSEMVILAAALSIQDPRDRPQEMRAGIRPRPRGVPRRGLRLPAAPQPVEVLRRRVPATRSRTASSARPAASISSPTCACASGATSPGSCARWPPS